MALLVGGPRHGEHVTIEPGQVEIRYAELPRGVGCFPGVDSSAPKPINRLIQEHHYRRMEGAPAVFEHESLWDSNVERAAKQLDREIQAIKEEYERAEKARCDAARRETEAAARWDKLAGRRAELRAKHGV